MFDFICIRRNWKLTYYLENIFRYGIPRAWTRRLLRKKLKTLSRYDESEIRSRVDYYNKLVKSEVDEEMFPLEEFTWSNRRKRKNNNRMGGPDVYFFDTYEYLRYFPGDLRASYRFGDITEVPPIPCLLKSRPIAGENSNSVLLKLNRVRHFQFIKDPLPFEKKRNMLVGRSVAKQPHRHRFLDRYFGHPMCDLGQVNPNADHPERVRKRMSIADHLNFKFILCLEGDDVASNLKWVLSSNSLAVMPKPTYETWFMEGTLIPNHHYVEIRSDYSDLEERMNYYIDHPEEAKRIVENAHAYIEQFFDKRKEELISLLVLKKYFERTGQTIAGLY